MERGHHSFYTSFYNTSPLWSGIYDGLEQFRFPHMDLTTFYLPPVPQNLRLGHQIEYAFQQLLSHSEHYRILVHNLSIDRNKISLGEIDFVLQDMDNGKLVHVELTYKFYIVTGDFGEAIDRQLLGPNKRDSFISKKERIKNHQLPLLYLPESVEALHGLKIDVRGSKQQVCFKSQLFIPFGWRSIDLDLGPFDPACIRGNWIFHKNFNSDGFGAYTYYRPTKSEWPLIPHDEVAWKTYGEIADEISVCIQRRTAPMVWIKDGSGALQKMFILF